MTVLSENKKNQYTCDGEQVVFPYTFLILDAAHLLVVYRDDEGSETVLTLNADPNGYTVDGVGEATGGNVTTTETYPALTTLTIVRDVPVTQETDYIENDIFPADSHERALDKLTMIVQEVMEKIGRAILGSITDIDPDLELPNSTIRAGKLLSFDEEGDVDLTDLVPAEEHASSHEVGGGDLVDHDNLPGFVASEHLSLPNLIANVLSNHTKAIHDALGLSHDSLADISVDDHHVKYTDAEVVSAIEAAGFTLVSAKVINSANEDLIFRFGRAFVGFASYADHASFGHRDMASAGNYGFMQSAIGDTMVNAPTGKTVKIRINNGNIQEVSTLGTFLNTLSAGAADYDKFVVADPNVTNLLKYRTGAQVLSDIGAVGAAGAVAAVEAAGLVLATTKVINSADEDLIFKFGRAQLDSRYTDCLILSHRDMTLPGSFALLQTATGATQINAATGQTLIFRINIVTQVTISASGLTLNTLSAEATDVDKFLVSNAGLVKYRTGVQVLSDIGGTALTLFNSHAARHHVGGADLVNHDSLTGFLAAEHLSLPNTIANVLSNHTKAIHDALGLSHDSLVDVSVDDHHAQAHTLASHSTKAHTELTGVSADQHHAQLHAPEHKAAGGDSIKLDELAQPTDVLTLNASTFWHGLMKKLSGSATEFLNGMGIWAIPAGSGGVYQHDFPDWSQIPEVTFDSGWWNVPGAVVNTQRFAHGIGSAPDLVFLWAGHPMVRSGSPIISPPRLTPVMDSHKRAVGPHIVDFDATNIDVHCNDAYLATEDSGGHYAFACSLRVVGINKTADYDSGWTAFVGTPTSTQIVQAHGLGVIPDFYTLELSAASDGVGSHVYAMCGQINHSGNYPTTIVDVNSTNIIFSCGNSQLCEYYDYGNNLIAINGAGWYWRIRAWTWTPDYTSSWFAVTCAANNSYVVQHDLGKIPFLALLEFSKASDGSNDIVPQIGWSSYATDPYSHGLYIASIGENVVSIHAERAGLARYEDSSGANQALTTGYARIKLWAT